MISLRDLKGKHAGQSLFDLLQNAWCLIHTVEELETYHYAAERCARKLGFRVCTSVDESPYHEELLVQQREVGDELDENMKKTISAYMFPFLVKTALCYSRHSDHDLYLVYVPLDDILQATLAFRP